MRCVGPFVWVFLVSDSEDEEAVLGERNWPQFRPSPRESGGRDRICPTSACRPARSLCIKLTEPHVPPMRQHQVRTHESPKQSVSPTSYPRESTLVPHLQGRVSSFVPGPKQHVDNGRVKLPRPRRRIRGMGDSEASRLIASPLKPVESRRRLRGLVDDV